jgi:hypothetical protein
MAGVKLKLDKAIALRVWLMQGGLQAILAHAMAFNDYVNEGEEAPWTWMKNKMAEDTTSEHMLLTQRLARDLAGYERNGRPEPAALAWSSIRMYLREEFHGDMKEPEADVRRAMSKEEGVTLLTPSNRARIWINGSPNHVLATMRWSRCC